MIMRIVFLFIHNEFSRYSNSNKRLDIIQTGDNVVFFWTGLKTANANNNVRFYQWMQMFDSIKSSNFHGNFCRNSLGCVIYVILLRWKWLWYVVEQNKNKKKTVEIAIIALTGSFNQILFLFKFRFTISMVCLCFECGIEFRFQSIHLMFSHRSQTHKKNTLYLRDTFDKRLIFTFNLPLVFVCVWPNSISRTAAGDCITLDVRISDAEIVFNINQIKRYVFFSFRFFLIFYLNICHWSCVFIHTINWCFLHRFWAFFHIFFR